ncbi:MAG: hypothetical protein CW691_10965 [Candidatus Bathyarchaeum sp.]|nr:MAG: hypothetical protein CW691_10965 [Candidatus Bathyarchaeum sp.]
MNKKIRTTTIAALMLIVIAVGSLSVVLGQPTTETRATRIVESAQAAEEKVGDLIDLVASNATALLMIETAGLTDAFEANVTLFGEGQENVTNALACLEAEDYEGAIENATDAMTIFREVYRAINEILCDSDVKICPSVDPEELEDAIDRSLAKIEDLKALISEDADIYSNITEAEDLLLEAKNELLPDDIEAAKDNLREANALISDVCQYLKEVAQDLNPARIRDYCEELQYRYRFGERFGQAETEGFDVNGFLQGVGYQNEDDFMTRFQEMIQNAQDTEDIEDAVDDLEEIGRFAREFDGSFNQQMGQFRAQHGQNNSGAGSSQQGSGSGSQTSGGSGQMGSGSGH